MKPEHPTGLELRFERELKAAIPNWQTEMEGADLPVVEPRPPRKPDGKRQIPRHRPHARKVSGK